MASAVYYGHHVGSFSNKLEGLGAEVYLADQDTVFVKDFHVDQGEDESKSKGRD